MMAKQSDMQYWLEKVSGPSELAKRIIDALENTLHPDVNVSHNRERAEEVVAAELQRVTMPHARTWIYNRVVNAMLCSCGGRVDFDKRLPAAIEAGELIERLKFVTDAEKDEAVEAFRASLD